MPPVFPTFLKEWQEPVRGIVAQQATAALQNSTAIIACVNALMSPTLNPWTCVACSNAVAVASSYNWSTTADIVPSTSGNRSWIVLENASGFQVMLAFDQADNFNLTMKFSDTAGFTGGTLTARPTATDEYGFGAVAWFCGNNVGRFRLTMVHSMDGRLTYLFLIRQGILCSMWLLGEAEPTHGSWSPANVGTVHGTLSLASGVLDKWTILDDNDRLGAYMASGSCFLRTTAAYSAGRMVTKQAYRESPTGNYQIWRIGLACVNSPRRGKHGNLIDLFRVNDGLPFGTILHSESGDRALMVIGAAAAIPWPPSQQPWVL